MNKPRLMIYVQNLLGIGHLRRAAGISRAAVKKGFDVRFVSGGFPIKDLNIGGAEFYQIPPVRSLDGDFKTLVTKNNKEIDDLWRNRRRQLLLDLFEKIRPQILLTELFPFGRRQFRFELIPLLTKAKEANCCSQVVCSMRDILVTKPRHDRNLEIVETLENFYQKILVHGDRKVISLAETFPLEKRISHLIEYTGYVLTPSHIGDTGKDGTGEIIVSAGGGAVGFATLPKIFNLRNEIAIRDFPWRFVTGPHMPTEIFNELSAKGTNDTFVERSRPDLPAVISRAKLSISQAGYNTIAELMNAGTPAVVVPYEGGVETEQRLRSDLLAKRSFLQVVDENELNVNSLNNAIFRALNNKPVKKLNISLDGASSTANLLWALL
ncbi:MAG: glycosyl transferase [Rhodospirillaceae bacterium]|nr:glycosyl transferase [Rhodospirillaceae bacterium]